MEDASKQSAIDVDEDLLKCAEMRKRMVNDIQKRSRNKILQRSRELLSLAYDEQIKNEECEEEVIQLAESIEGLEIENNGIDTKEQKQEIHLSREERKKERKELKVQKMYAREVQSILSNPEWLISLNQFNPNEYDIASIPNGIRCLVISRNNKTSVRDTKGRMIIDYFQSSLPGGSSKKGNCMLDCIFIKNERVFWVLDIIEYNNILISENSSEMRFFWAQSYLKGLEQRNNPDDYSFQVLPRTSLTNQSSKEVLQNAQAILFLKKENPYYGGMNSESFQWKRQDTNTQDNNNNLNNNSSILCNLICDCDKNLVTIDNYIIKKLTKEETHKFNIKNWDIIKFQINHLHITESIKTFISQQHQLQEDEEEGEEQICKTEKQDDQNKSKFLINAEGIVQEDRFISPKFNDVQLFPDSLSHIIFNWQSLTNSGVSKLDLCSILN